MNPDDPTEVWRPPFAARESPSRGGTIGVYELLELLGRGGCGSVHRARHATLGKVVALKLLEGGSEHEVARFVQEARAIAALDHPNVVRVHDVGEASGRWFIVMDLAPGGTLAGVVRRAKEERKDPTLPCIAPERALLLVEKVARAIAHAHERGIIHRDLKPSNVLLSAEGEPLVADFGLARRLDGAKITATGDVLGTPAYMAPEQARGEKVDVRADVYALGAILNELVTGLPPIPTTGVPMHDLVAAASAERVSPRRRVPSLPVAFETIVLRALAPEPGERYASALALAQDLARARLEEPIEARPVSTRKRLTRWARRRRAALFVAGLAALAVAAAGALVGERVAERRTWETVARFPTDSGGTLRGWEPLEGTWSVTGGELEGRGRPARLALAAPVEGDVRVTLLGRLLPPLERDGGDLSVELLPGQFRDEDSGYFFGFGTGGNAFSKLARQGRRVALLEGPRARAVPGRLHRIQVEREGASLRLAVDGEPLLEHRDLIPLDMAAGSRVVLYTWSARARFEAVTVERRSAALRPGRSEVADRLFEQGEPSAAARLYAEAARAPGLSSAERSELELKRGLAEIGDAARFEPPLRDQLGRALAILEPLARATPMTELALRAEVALAEIELLSGSLEAGFARARRAAAVALPAARDTVRGLLAREDARLLGHARHEERLALLRETLSIFSSDPRVDFEATVATAESLVELGRVHAAADLLGEAIARHGAEPGARFELLLELAAARSRGGELDLAREAVAACLSASRGQGDDLAMRTLVEEATLELDAGDRAATRTLAAARGVATRVPSHLAVVAALEAEAGLDEAVDRSALLAALDAAARAGAAERATDTARLFGARAALAAAASRLVAREEPAARAALGEAVSSRATLSTTAASALLLDALLEERAGHREAARQALERAAGSRTPHLAAVARALAQGPVGADTAARLLDASGECRRDRALLALALGGFALHGGDATGASLLEQARAEGAPAPVRAIALSLQRR